MTIKESIDKICSFNRISADPNGLKDTINFIEQEIAPAPTFYQQFDINNKTFYNLIIPSKSKSKIIIGAHLDCIYGVGTGADDNASGVITLVELIKRNKREDIEFVFFATEEPPFFTMGSKIYYEQYIIPNNYIVKLMINIDMVGVYKNQNTLQIGAYHFPPEEEEIIKEILKNDYINFEFLNLTNKFHILNCADHLHFYNHKIKSIIICNGGPYTNFVYHTPLDAPNILNYKKMGQLIKVLHNFLIKIPF